MKQVLLGIISTSLVVTLAACSPAAAVATQAPANTEGAPVASAEGTPEPGGFTQNPNIQLLFGTFALEGTDNAVTAAQAKTLLPLWQGLEALSQSDTTAPEELTAIETQLRAAYTADQLTAIEALTPEEIQKVMSDQGLSFGRGANANGTPAPNGTPGAGGGGFGDGGGRGFGGNGGGGGGFGGGGNGGGGFDPNNISPEQQATFEARRAQGGGGGFGGGGGLPAPLLQAVIDFLTTRAAS